MKEPITAKWVEIIFYDLTFVYNYFGTAQLTTFGHAMPLQGTGNHFWSICSEEQFYLIAPFLITLLPWKIGRTIPFWAALAVLVLASEQWENFGAISLGVLASVLRDRFGNWHLNQVATWALGIVAIFGFLAAYNDIGYRLAAPLSAICIILSFAREGAYSRTAAFVGGISYPMYLNHWIGVFLANALFGRFGLRDSLYCRVSGVLLGLIVATALYVLIDRNVRKHREQYFSVFRGKVLAATGFTLVTIGTSVGIALMMLYPTSP